METTPKTFETVLFINDAEDEAEVSSAAKHSGVILEFGEIDMCGGTETKIIGSQISTKQFLNILEFDRSDINYILNNPIIF